MMRILSAALMASVCTALPALAQNPPQRPAVATDIAAASRGFERRDGFIPVLLDAEQGKIYLELPGDSTRALVLFTLATGLGSNPFGLDRGTGGGEQVARFERSGGRILVIFENWNYRSSPAHSRAAGPALDQQTSSHAHGPLRPPIPDP